MKRKAIRARAVALLAGLSGYTIREFDGKTAAQTEVPGVVVRWGQEEVEEDIQNLSGTQVIHAELMLDVTISGASNQDDIDDAIFDIRGLFHGDRTLESNATQNYYLGSSEPEAGGEGSDTVFNFTVTIKVTYEE